MGSSRFNQRLIRFSFVAVGLIAAFLFAEALVRLFYPHTRDFSPPAGIFSIDQDLGWKLSPQTAVTHQSRYFDVEYSVNAFGYRDRPRSISKQPNVCRVLLFGASQVFGWGIPAELRFSNLIDSQYPDMELWNMAVPAYGLDQQLLSYEREGGRFNADEVVFSISGITLKRMRYAYRYKKHKPKFELNKHGDLVLVETPKFKSLSTDLFYKMLSPFYLPYFIDQRLRKLKKKYSEKDPDTVIAPKPDREVFGNLDRKIVDRIKSVTQARRHRFTLLTNPGGASKQYKLFCEETGVNCLEIALSGNDQYLSIGEHDSHWSASANKQISEQLAPKLARNCNSS